MEHLTRAVTVQRPRAEVYAYWRDFTNLSAFMYHVVRVDITAPGRSHWVVKAPAGTTVEWDAEVIQEETDRIIAWRSLAGSEVENSGSVMFADAPADRGTEVRVELRYAPPGGALGASAAKWLGSDPEQQLADDLRRFKQVLETGEVLVSEGSPEGVGEGVSNEQPAQPSAAVPS